MNSSRLISRADWLIGLLLGLLEVAVIAPCAIVLTTMIYGASARSVPALGVAVMLVGGYSSTRFLLAKARRLVMVRLGILAAGIVVALGALRLTIDQNHWLTDVTWLGDLFADLRHFATGISPQLTGLGIYLFCWWLGARLATEPLSSERVLETVQTWAVVLILAFVLAGNVFAVPAVRTALARAVPLAFVFALFALALSRFAIVQKETRTSSHRVSVRLPWLGTVVAVTGGVLVIALVVEQLLGFRSLDALLRGATVAVRLLNRLLSFVLLAFASVIFFVLTPLIHLGQRFFRHSPSVERQEVRRRPPALDQVHHAIQQHLPAWIVSGLNLLVAAALIVGLSWLLLGSLRRYRTMPRTTESVEEHESLWSRDLVLNRLRNVLPRRRPRHRVPTPMQRAREPQSVRAVYAAICVEAAEHGLPRQPAETPNEFAVRLRATWPDEAEYWTAVTAAYCQVRYEGGTPSLAEWRRIKATWQRLYRRLGNAGLASVNGRIARDG